MKKRILLGLSCLMVSICLTGCGDEDKVHAIAEMSTNTGRADLKLSFNGLGKANSGSWIAQSYASKWELKDGEILKVHFYCDACGHDENLEITAPDAKMLNCDCPEDGDENKNAREYVCIIATSSVSESE